MYDDDNDTHIINEDGTIKYLFNVTKVTNRHRFQYHHLLLISKLYNYISDYILKSNIPYQYHPIADIFERNIIFRNSLVNQDGTIDDARSR